MKTFIIGALAFTIAALPSALHAQRPIPVNDGLWFGANFGRGFARVDCTICRGGRPAAMTGSVRMGSRVQRRVLIGAEVTGWMRDENQIQERIWTISGVAQYYLRGAPKLFIKGGVSAVSYRIEDTQETLSSSAIGLLAGVGYDVPINGRFYLTPSATLTRSLIGGTLKFNGGEMPDRARVSLLQIGIGITRK